MIRTRTGIESALSADMLCLLSKSQMRTSMTSQSGWIIHMNETPRAFHTAHVIPAALFLSTPALGVRKRQRRIQTAADNAGQPGSTPPESDTSPLMLVGFGQLGLAPCVPHATGPHQ